MLKKVRVTLTATGRKVDLALPRVQYEILNHLLRTSTTLLGLEKEFGEVYAKPAVDHLVSQGLVQEGQPFEDPFGIGTTITKYSARYNNIYVLPGQKTPRKSKKKVSQEAGVAA